MPVRSRNLSCWRSSQGGSTAGSWTGSRGSMSGLVSRYGQESKQRANFSFFREISWDSGAGYPTTRGPGSLIGTGNVVYRLSYCMINSTIVYAGSQSGEMVPVPTLTTLARPAGSTTTAPPPSAGTTRQGLLAKETALSWKSYLTCRLLIEKPNKG